jgi:hypothetical protein
VTVADLDRGRFAATGTLTHVLLHKRSPEAFSRDGTIPPLNARIVSKVRSLHKCKVQICWKSLGWNQLPFGESPAIA